MYEFYLMILVITPTSAVPIFKYSVTAAFLFYSLFSFLQSPKNDYKVVMPFAAGLFFILLFALVGFVFNNEPSDVFLESLTYLLFISSLFFQIQLYPKSRNFTKYVCIAFSIYCVGKFFVFISAASFTGLISPLQVYFTIKEYVPSAVVTSFGGTGTPRIVFANDYLLPIFLFWIVCFNHFGKISNKLSFVMGILTLTVILLSLSRYLYLLTAIVLFLTASLRFNFKTIAIYSFILILAVSTIPYLLSLVGYDDLLQTRVSGNVASASNELKMEQISILNQFYDSPIIGQGLGLALEIHGRELGYAFLAEVEWLAILAKTGFVGVLFFLFILSRISLTLLSKKKRAKDIRVNLFVMTLFFAWLSVGITNPVLFISTTSVNYLLLYSIWYENMKRS